MNRLEQKYGKNYTTNEIAEFLQIDIRTARRKCNKIKGSFKVGRKILVPEKSFENYLENNGRVKKESSFTKTNKQRLISSVDETLQEFGINNKQGEI